MIDALNPFYVRVRDWWYQNRDVADVLFPELYCRVQEAFRNDETTEEEYRALLKEIKHVPADEKWPTQTDVARGLRISKPTVKRMIERDELHTNRQTGHKLRIDPASVLEYCKREGATWNES